jgi:hypothetical protein
MPSSSLTSAGLLRLPGEPGGCTGLLEAGYDHSEEGNSGRSLNLLRKYRSLRFASHNLVLTSYFTVSHATCVKILKFTSKFKSLVHYVFRLIWSSSGDSIFMLESDALPTMYTIPNLTLLYEPICCTFVVMDDSSCVSCIGPSGWWNI